jgi:hypothetical protein
MVCFGDRKTKILCFGDWLLGIVCFDDRQTNWLTGITLSSSCHLDKEKIQSRKLNSKVAQMESNGIGDQIAGKNACPKCLPPGKPSGFFTVLTSFILVSFI